MSECGEELYRIATALEKIAKQGEKSPDNEANIVAGVHNLYALEIEAILDALNNEFELRRSLRNLVRRAKEMGSQ